MNHTVGLDIGGANLKAAHSDGSCRSRAFAIWKSPENLADELSELVADWLPCRLLAVTMTAELADCFETKAEGVDRILNAVETISDTTPIGVWQTSGEFVSAAVAREFPLLTAAANWHALATFAGRIVPGLTALLIDVGTTTTDIIPIIDGIPDPTGRTDSERLVSGELVYSGVRRTPICAVAYSVPLAGAYSQLAAELFATTLDVYLLLGQIPEGDDDCETANGQPATVMAAHDRMARQLCCDRNEIPLETARDIARFLADVQRQRIRGAVDRVLARLESTVEAVLISGSGSFLARQIVDEHPRLSGLERHHLDELFTAETSEAACAFAVARLAAEMPCSG